MTGLLLPAHVAVQLALPPVAVRHAREHNDVVLLNLELVILRGLKVPQDLDLLYNRGKGRGEKQTDAGGKKWELFRFDACKGTHTRKPPRPLSLLPAAARAVVLCCAVYLGALLRVGCRLCHTCGLVEIIPMFCFLSHSSRKSPLTRQNNSNARF